MSVSVKFTAPTEEVLQFIADNMRQADIEEVAASHGHTPIQALCEGVKISDSCVVAIANDEPVAVFGLVRGCVLSGYGTPWALGTDSLFEYKKSFMKWSRVLLAMMLNEFDHLENFVHVKNQQSVRWLKWLGFQFEEPQPYGLKRELFMKFYLEKERV